MSIKSFLIIFFSLWTVAQHSYAQKVLNAREIVAKASEKAKVENKNVFIMFHASWCYWCHKMDTLMNMKAVKPYFDTSYVIVHIDVNENDPAKKKLETPGGNELFQRYAGSDPSVPFWIVLNPDGTLIGDSRFHAPDSNPQAAGVNIGCPSKPEEIVMFQDIVRKSSSLNEQQVGEIGLVFQGKKTE